MADRETRQQDAPVLAQTAYRSGCRHRADCRGGATQKEVDDGAEVAPLLDQVLGPMASFTGNGAYDQESVSAAVTTRDPEAAIIVPPRATAVPSEMAETAPT